MDSLTFEIPSDLMVTPMQRSIGTELSIHFPISLEELNALHVLAPPKSSRWFRNLWRDAYARQNGFVGAQQDPHCNQCTQFSTALALWCSCTSQQPLFTDICVNTN